MKHYVVKTENANHRLNSEEEAIAFFRRLEMTHLSVWMKDCPETWFLYNPATNITAYLQSVGDRPPTAEDYRRIARSLGTTAQTFAEATLHTNCSLYPRGEK